MDLLAQHEVDEINMDLQRSLVNSHVVRRQVAAGAAIRLARLTQDKLDARLVWLLCCWVGCLKFWQREKTLDKEYGAPVGT